MRRLPGFRTEPEILSSELCPDVGDAAALRKRRTLDAALRWFRSCVVCSASLPPIDLLCPSCWTRFGHLQNRGTWMRQPDYPFPVYSLLTWTDENDAFVRPLVYGLKGGFQIGAYEKLINLFSFERGWGASKAKPLVLFPQASGDKIDHSRLFALLISEYWQTSSIELKWENFGDEGAVRSQKQLSAGERTRRRFREEIGAARFTDPETARIFVDDVITTGATAMAAYMASGSPAQFEVWTLICRPKLAASRGF